MSRLSFALTIAILFGALVVLSAFAFRTLLVSGPGNEDQAEATQQVTQATQTTEETTTYEEETTAYKEETTAFQAGGKLKAPPLSTLSYLGREVRSSASGSYCWTYSTEGGRWASGCFDGILLAPPRKKTLYIPSGSEMVFRYGRQRPPNKVSATAYNLLGRIDTNGGGLGAEHPMKAHGSGVERTIPAELAPREYLVVVGITEPQGDVTYAFRVMVR